MRVQQGRHTHISFPENFALKPLFTLTTLSINELAAASPCLSVGSPILNRARQLAVKKSLFTTVRHRSGKRVGRARPLRAKCFVVAGHARPDFWPLPSRDRQQAVLRATRLQPFTISPCGSFPHRAPSVSRGACFFRAPSLQSSWLDPLRRTVPQAKSV